MAMKKNKNNFTKLTFLLKRFKGTSKNNNLLLIESEKNFYISSVQAMHFAQFTNNVGAKSLVCQKQ